MSIIACFLYNLFKKLAFVPVASVMTAVHRDCVVLASYVPRPEIQPLESRGQIVSAWTFCNRPTDGWMDKYNDKRLSKYRDGRVHK